LSAGAIRWIKWQQVPARPVPAALPSPGGIKRRASFFNRESTLEKALYHEKICIEINYPVTIRMSVDFSRLRKPAGNYLARQALKRA
jgi:hypothetical protein